MSQALFDTVMKQQKCKNDAELSRILKIDPGALSRMRHKKLKVGAVLILRIHKLTNISVKDIEAMIEGKINDDEFYLQDSRSYVGNDILFWQKDGGYTTDVSKAQIYTKQQAASQHKSRDTDIPWPRSYIDSKTRPAVDVQYVKRNEAMIGDKS